MEDKKYNELVEYIKQQKERYTELVENKVLNDIQDAIIKERALSKLEIIDDILNKVFKINWNSYK